MNDQKFYNSVALAAVGIVLVSFAIGFLGASYASPSTPARAPAASGSSPYTVYLTISTLPSGADQYLPANFSVPVNTPVRFVISSYDNGVNNLTPVASMVAGTTGGTESISGGAPGTPQGPVTSLPAGDATHTFSILSGGMDLNAVVPPAADPSHAVQVTFTVVFPTIGTWTWMCLAPCDLHSMASEGFMSGTLTVA